jgi:hypothetical protein
MSKAQARSLFPENSALSPDGRRVALDISNQKANDVDLWIESFDGASNARFPLDFSGWIIGPDCGRVTGDSDLTVAALL